MNVKDLINVINSIEDTRSISNEVIISALSEGLIKAYRKHINNPDVECRVEINEDDTIHLYLRQLIVEEVIDDEAEISLEDAKVKDPDCELGGYIETEVRVEDFGRSCVTLVKNVMLQKIKEASKQVIYDEYVDKVSDLVYATVETVEDKFILVNLGKTLAVMKKIDQIPNEIYKSGNRIRVIISAVSKESKGSQVMVSRSSADLVKRLFETTVPEIYDGTVCVKAIAREANERTKMAVYSNNANVDAIGACIGPRGSRVIAVIEEITQRNNPLMHENIDIVEWSNNYIEYVKNVMKPANVLAVIPNTENNGLLVVVEDNQLSLAIGKKGINARLAVKLLNRKIDIKTQSDVEAQNINWYDQMLAFQAKEAARLQAEEVNRLAKIQEDLQKAQEEMEKPAESELIVEEPTITEEKPVEKETAIVEEEKTVVKHRRPKLTVKASDYVSKFETLADAKKTKETVVVKRKKDNNKDESEDKEIKEKIEALKNKDYEIKPEYSQEEEEEFNNSKDEHWYDDDVNYDEYDEFYDK